MMKLVFMTVAAILAFTLIPGAAADFDGSRLLICANREAAYCGSGQACMMGRPDDIGAPVFLRIDFANSSIIGTNRTTPIVRVEKSSSQLLLQGTELDYAWSLALDTADGNLAATLVDREEVVVLFGACTPL
jgi:hypothetical protein